MRFSTANGVFHNNVEWVIALSDRIGQVCVRAFLGQFRGAKRAAAAPGRQNLAMIEEAGNGWWMLSARPQ